MIDRHVHTCTMGVAFSQNDLNINPGLYSQYLHRDVEPVCEQYENHLSTLARNIQRCLKADDITGFKSFLNYFDTKHKKTIVIYKIDGISCVHIACRSNNAQSIQFMLEECDIDPNMKLNSLNETPLHIACQSGKVGVCKCLIAYRADVHLVTKNDQSCLTLAGEDKNVCKLLISNGVDANAWKNKDNLPMIFDACENGDDNLVKFLVDNHANMICKNKRGLSPIEVAAHFYLYQKYNRSLRMIAILMQADDIDPSDKIKALELIGCERIKRYILPVRDKPCLLEYKSKYLDQAKRYWQKSIDNKEKELTFDYGSQSPCNRSETRTVFDVDKKFESLEDLERIFLDKKDILLQAAIVMDLIFGINNDQVILFLKHLSKHCVEEDLLDDGIQIISNVLNYIIANIHNVVEKAWLEEFQYVFLYWVRFHEKINFDETHLTFKTMIWFLDQLASSSSSDGLSNFLSPTNVETIFAILKYIANWQCVTKRESCLSAIVDKFQNHKFMFDDISLLHYCVEAYFCWNGNDELRSFKCTQLMRYLLENGMSPDITDAFGHTPLITCIQCWDFLNPSRENIIKLLIEYSHLDMVTQEGHCALTLLKAIEFPFSEVRYVPLQCLAAKVILKENIPYKTLVPVSVANFIDTHRQYGNN